MLRFLFSAVTGYFIFVTYVCKSKGLYVLVQRGFSCTTQVLFVRTFVLKLGKAYEPCNRAIKIVITKTVSLFHANTVVQ